ncbi:hypothetical protein ABEB36_011794 [Hypothenemus hampei]|uniref:Uncharacterized protein n=1 Tax=Hypothenemus hampei TaxID=57062 RepID=A0ABD1E916_HYPHA
MNERRNESSEIFKSQVDFSPESREEHGLLLLSFGKKYHRHAVQINLFPIGRLRGRCCGRLKRRRNRHAMSSTTSKQNTVAQSPPPVFLYYNIFEKWPLMSYEYLCRRSLV